MSLKETAKKLFKTDKPFAIAMWDFSWIERRWPGAGYEDWDEALSQLVDRGYNAVRIDAFPHFVSKDIAKIWTVYPVWNTQDWGSPSVNRIRLEDDFPAFLRACRRHSVRVGLSTWFRQDEDHSEMDIKTPRDLSDIWVKTLDKIKEWGEYDNVLYVDMCNEFPQPAWAPFLRNDGSVSIGSETSLCWMREATARFKEFYPDMPVTFSFTDRYENENLDVGFLDFIEAHIWMTTQSDFYRKAGYAYERFDDKGYTNMALYGKELYTKNREYYDKALADAIHRAARWAKNMKKPLVTTECWAVTDYKDAPLLDWDWVLELNRFGVLTALDTGCWAGMATSNFCGPQFNGMWREKLWHKELTEKIKSGGMI